MAFKIGIDTGGTYTDAVLFDDQVGVLASAKSLTTPHNLSEGIGAALEQLPSRHFTNVELVSVSTTLATNAVIEGQGAPICSLLPGYNQRQIERSGLTDILRNDPVVLLAGGHDAGGMEQQPLDLEEARRQVEKHSDSVSAFAVSALFGVRNPAHEIALKHMIQELCDKPVTCGHELSSCLDAPRRALTAALNARLTPFIRRLVEAVQARLDVLGIEAPLMMVKGDGSLVNVAVTMAKPVDTVLSGPAASVVGACFLSGRKNALVADMGGTTTDIAVVTDGRPETRSDGALIGDWHPMVETLSVYSIGLGGDSEVRYSGGEGIGIGPRRVVPLCLLVEQFPEVLPQLEAQTRMGASPRLNRFAIKLYEDPAVIRRLNTDEMRAWELLCDRQPLNVETITESQPALARALARLVRRGLAIYSGFTPTDAAHVLGISNHWNADAARMAAGIWAYQMRHRYGLGNWKVGDIETPCHDVMRRLNEILSEALVRTGVRELDQKLRVPSDELVRFLSNLLGYSDNKVFTVSFNQDYPLLAVGAPAAAFFPETGERLNMDLDVPERAEVAGAVGTVASKVVQRFRIVVTQPAQGVFRVHEAAGPRDFDVLESALVFAEETALDSASRLAVNAGANTPELSVERFENRVDHDIDGSVFFEATVCATATGAPA